MIELTVRECLSAFQHVSRAAEQGYKNAKHGYWFARAKTQLEIVKRDYESAVKQPIKDLCSRNDKGEALVNGLGNYMFTEENSEKFDAISAPLLEEKEQIKFCEPLPKIEEMNEGYVFSGLEKFFEEVK